MVRGTGPLAKGFVNVQSKLPERNNSTNEVARSFGQEPLAAPVHSYYNCFRPPALIAPYIDHPYGLW